MTYWRGWHDLRHDRPHGPGGPGGISYAAISAWCRDHGLAGADAAIFAALVRAMDEEFLAVLAERRQAAQDRNRNTTP